MATKLSNLKQIHSRSGLSKIQLLIFSVAFAAVGGIILISSFALDSPGSSEFGVNTTVDGVVLTNHAEAKGWGPNSSEDSDIDYNIVSTPTKSYKVQLSKGAKQLADGEHVRVRGKLKGQAIDASSSQNDVIPTEAAEANSLANQPVKAADTQRTIGPQKVLIILASVHSVAVDSQMTLVNQFYNKVSFGKVPMTWTTVRIPASTYNPNDCSDIDMHKGVAAADPQVDFSQIDRFVLVTDNECFGGMGGSADFSTNEGTFDLGSTEISYSSFNYFVIEHELGHSFGEGHAHTYICPNGPLPTPANISSCAYDEYGDAFSVMGYSGVDMNGPERLFPGWLNSGNVLNVTQSGTYNLETLDPNTNNLKALSIQRNTCASEDLWVEYTTEGVDIRVIGSTDVTSFNYSYDGECYPNIYYGGHYLTATLTPGQSITDPNTGDVIKALSTNGTTASVSVQVHRTDFTAPTFSWTNPIAYNPSSSSPPPVVSGTIQLQGTPSDPSGVQKVTYRLDDVDIATLVASPWKYSLDTTQLADGQHKLAAVVTDNAATQWGGYSNVSPSGFNGGGYLSYIDVENHVSNGPDTTPPTASITAPAAGSTVKGTFAFTVSASDNVFVTEVNFYVDGVPYTSDTTAPFSFTADTNVQVGGKPYFAAGCHTLTAIASDAAGNQGTSAPVKVVFGSGSCPASGGPVIGDANGDGRVDGSDLAVILTNWNTTFAGADLNKDGRVDVLDLSIVLSHYGV